jgi:hypothetical protein
MLMKYNKYTPEDKERMSRVMENPLIESTMHVEYILKIYRCQT